MYLFYCRYITLYSAHAQIFHSQCCSRCEPHSRAVEDKEEIQEAAASLASAKRD